MVARTKTWIANETLTAADLNAEFDPIIAAISTGTADHIDLTDAYAWTGAHTWGVDDTGVDVKFFGDAAGAFGIWDTSANGMELRGATAAGPGTLLLSTAEVSVVDGNILGRIDFQAPLDTGLDSDLVGASIWAEADDTFSDTINDTDLVFAVAESETATERMRLSYDGTNTTLHFTGGDPTFSQAGTGDLVISGMSMEFDDNEGVVLGTGKDASFKFDATNTIAATAGALILQTNGSTEAMRIGSSQIIFTGGETSNAGMSAGGLTLSQGTADNEILAFKSPGDVDHPMTDFAEANTWGSYSKTSGSAGGLSVNGYKDSDGGANNAIRLRGILGEAAETGHTTSSRGVVNIEASITDGGTNDADVDAAGIFLSFRNHSTTRVLFLGDGTVHASDTSWATALDDIPDALAGRALTTERSGGMLEGYKIHAPHLVQVLEDRKVVTPEDETGHRFLNLQNAAKFSWDIGFQNFEFMHAIAGVLTDDQRERLPQKMKDAFLLLEQNKQERLN